MIKIMCQVGNQKEYTSMHNGYEYWKTFSDFEKGMAVCNDPPYAQDYVVYCGAVKRRYRYNEATNKWERVLHPRGTKRKVKKEVVKCEFGGRQDQRQIPNGNWSNSFGDIHWLEENLHKPMSMETVYHHHRVTYTNGSVVYYTHSGDNILGKYDTLPEWHTKQATPSVEINTITSTPVKEKEKKVTSNEFFNRDKDGWDKSEFTYEELLKFVGTNYYPCCVPRRITFNDGSVTYFTRDGNGKPLYETSEDPTVKKMEVTMSPVPVSVPWIQVCAELLRSCGVTGDSAINRLRDALTKVLTTDADMTDVLSKSIADATARIKKEILAKLPLAEREGKTKIAQTVVESFVVNGSEHYATAQKE